MRDEIIFSKLNQHYKLVKQAYPIERVFGIFVTDILEQEKDILSEAIIIPDFGDICTSFSSIDGVIGDKITIMDIRKVYRATAEGHPETIKSLYTKYFIVNPLYEHLFEKLYIADRDVIKTGIEQGIPAPQLKTAIMKVCRMCWNETSNAVRFIKQLTDAEKVALDGIVKAIGDEGTFSQAKVAASMGIARLTMTNLVLKMEACGVAIVEYHGVKGTYIKFIDDTLLDPHGLLSPREKISER